MNLFATDPNPIIAAQHLDDIRLNKMITESCQMLVIALVANGLPKHKIPLTKSGQPYKTKGHANHPITKWTGRTRGNFLWHVMYLEAMMIEYHHRTGKTRAGVDVIDTAISNINLIPDGVQEPFHNSSLYSDNDVRGVIYCYRLTMGDKWMKDKIKVKWTKRKPPDWCAVRTVEVDGVHYRFTKREESSLDQLLVGVDPQP